MKCNIQWTQVIWSKSFDLKWIIVWVNQLKWIVLAMIKWYWIVNTNLIENGFELRSKILYCRWLLSFTTKCYPFIMSSRSDYFFRNYINETAVETVSQHNKYIQTIQLFQSLIRIGLFMCIWLYRSNFYVEKECVISMGKGNIIIHEFELV